MVTMKSAKKAKTCIFSLNELVMAKFEDYPEWPAIVKRCFWEDEKHHKKWRLSARGRRPAQVWCYFLNDDSANWVHEVNVRPFSANVNVDDILSSHHEHYENLKAAIQKATVIFTKREAGVDMSETEDEGVGGPTEGEDEEEEKSGRLKTREPVLAGRSKHTGSVDGERGGSPDSPVNRLRMRRSSDRTCTAEGEATPTHPEGTRDTRHNGLKASGSRKKRPLDDPNRDDTNPRGKKPKNNGSSNGFDSSDFSSKGSSPEMSKEVKSLTQKLSERSAELERAVLEVHRLRKILKEKEALLDEIKKSPSKGLIDVPSFPDQGMVDLPSPSTYNSKAVSSKEFDELMKEFNATFSSFAENIKKSMALRKSLDKRIMEIRDELKNPCLKIEEQEKLAVADEIELVKILIRILVSKVSINDLRRSRAGKLIKRVCKSCTDMPQIRLLTAKIYESWTKQIDLDNERLKGSSFAETGEKSDSNPVAEGKPVAKKSVAVASEPVEKHGKKPEDCSDVGNSSPVEITPDTTAV